MMNAAQVSVTSQSNSHYKCMHDYLKRRLRDENLRQERLGNLSKALQIGTATLYEDFRHSLCRTRATDLPSVNLGSLKTETIMSEEM